MENLEIKIGSLSFVRKFMGIIIGANGIIWIFLYLESHKPVEIVYSFFFFFAGLFNIFDGFGLENSYIRQVEGGLEIK